MVVQCGVPPEQCLSSMCIHSNEWCCKQLRLPQRNPPDSVCVSTLSVAMVSHCYMTGSNAQYTPGKETAAQRHVLSSILLGMFWTLPLVLQDCEAMSMTVTYRINCIFSDQRKSICHVKLLLIREQFKLNLQLSICVTDWVCVDVSTR